ncbi:hypothetical protein T4A_214 [Trichinella pseudospiralis]|uniref:Uncharacterized protein n=1 Tax=Trichinella pseudospiralis TaxID=6337 RepID=A0A0V1E4N3_TRIPS|nr:hypothetical protein T4A_214 [Trichinella pseudospiralis]
MLRDKREKMCSCKTDEHARKPLAKHLLHNVELPDSTLLQYRWLTFSSKPKLHDDYPHPKHLCSSQLTSPC